MTETDTGAAGHEVMDVQSIQEKWLPVWDELAPFRSGDPTTTAPKQVRARHVPVPLRRPAHGSRRGVRARRRRRAVLGPARLQRDAPDRLGRVRAARGERRDQARGRPAGVDVREHRAAEGVDAPLRVLVRLGPGAATPATPSTTGGTSGCSCGSSSAGLAYRKASNGQLVPQRPDRAGQRAGGRRAGASAAAPRSPRRS